MRHGCAVAAGNLSMILRGVAGMKPFAIAEGGAFVEDQRALEQLCEALRERPGLMVDTEFMRRNTYYAQLCLVQVAAGDVIACIDVLQCESLEPLTALLYAPGCAKVMHSCRQDVEVLLQMYGAPPAPLFDTQVAACACGLGEQVGYGQLVKEVLGVTLDKSSTVTDWSARPLRPAQLAYAYDDVRYMEPLYRELHARLEALGRLAWVREDCTGLADPALYDTDPQRAWMRLGGGTRLPPANQQVLKRLAVWREALAQRLDRPREWIVSSAALYEVARVAPRTTAGLAALKTLPPRTLQRRGRAILEQIERGLGDEAVPLWERRDGGSGDAQAFKARFARARALLDERCRAQDVASSWVASRDDLRRLLCGERNIPLLHGWRLAVAGEYLLEALEL